MANSLIEDVMNEQPISENGSNQKKSKNKKSKKIIIILIILILIIIACIAGVLIWLNSQKSVKTAKQGFFETVTKSNVQEIGTMDLYTEFFEDMFSENSSVETNVDISFSSEDVSVDNISLNIDSKNDIENLETYSNMTLNYSDNEIFNLEFLANSEALALKSDEIISNYVGLRYEYILNNLISAQNNSDSEDYGYELYQTSDLEANLDEENNLNNEALLTDESIQMYKDILVNNLDDSQFSKKDVTLEMDSGTVDCTEYTLTMSETQLVDICKQLLQGFETDTDTIEVFSSILSIYGYSESDLIDVVDSMIEQLEDTKTNESTDFVIKAYDNNGQTVKLNIQYDGITMEIEYVYGDESSIKITAVEDETEDGLSYKITNKKSDLTQNVDFEMSVIEEGLVSQTVTFSTEVVKSGSDYTLNLGYEIKSQEQTISVDSVSDIEFTDVDIDDLTTDNCVYIDDLTEEEQTALLNSISEKAQAVLSEKISELSFIDTNTDNRVVDQGNVTEDDDSEKETAKQDLIEAIQTEMTNSLNNGEEYTIQDLEDLKLENHEIEVKISDDIAVVTVDGYTFNIDSEFNLSEE